MGKENQMIGCLQVVEVTAQCVMAVREVELWGKGQMGQGTSVFNYWAKYKRNVCHWLAEHSNLALQLLPS